MPFCKWTDWCWKQRQLSTVKMAERLKLWKKWWQLCLKCRFWKCEQSKIDENTQNLKWDVCHKFNDKLLKCQIHRYFGQKSPADILDKVLKEVSYDKRVSEWIQKKSLNYKQMVLYVWSSYQNNRKHHAHWIQASQPVTVWHFKTIVTLFQIAIHFFWIHSMPNPPKETTVIHTSMYRVLEQK